MIRDVSNTVIVDLCVQLEHAVSLLGDMNYVRKQGGYVCTFATGFWIVQIHLLGHHLEYVHTRLTLSSSLHTASRNPRYSQLHIKLALSHIVRK